MACSERNVGAAGLTTYPNVMRPDSMGIAFLTRHRWTAKMIAELLAGTNPGADRAGRPQAGPLLAELYADPAQEPG